MTAVVGKVDPKVLQRNARTGSVFERCLSTLFKASCGLPSIDSRPSIVFANRVKARPTRNAGVIASPVSAQLARLLGIEESKTNEVPLSGTTSAPTIVVSDADSSAQQVVEKPKVESPAAQSSPSGSAKILKVKSVTSAVEAPPTEPAPVVPPTVEVGIVPSFVNKKWIQAEGCFDFGPLVIGKDPSLKNVDPQKTASPPVTSKEAPVKTQEIAKQPAVVVTPPVTVPSTSIRPGVPTVAPSNNRALSPSSSSALLPSAAKVAVVPKILPEYLASVRKVNSAVFRISNSGSVQSLRVDFSFKNDVKQPLFVPNYLTLPNEPEALDPKNPKRVEKSGALSSRKLPVAPSKQDPKKANKKANVEEPEEANDVSVFSFEPAFMELAAGESRDLLVWAFPQSPGLVQDTLVCTVKNNPEAVLFPISCMGAIPQLRLNAATVEFDRILLDQQSFRSVVVENLSPIPVAWALRAPASLALLTESDLGLVSVESKTPRRSFLPSGTLPASKKQSGPDANEEKKEAKASESKASPAVSPYSTSVTTTSPEKPSITPLPLSDIISTDGSGPVLKSSKTNKPKESAQVAEIASQPEGPKSGGQYGVFPAVRGVLQPFSSQRLVFRFTATAAALCLLPLALEYGDVDGVWPSPSMLR